MSPLTPGTGCGCICYRRNHTWIEHGHYDPLDSSGVIKNVNEIVGGLLQPVIYHMSDTEGLQIAVEVTCILACFALRTGNVLRAHKRVHLSEAFAFIGVSKTRRIAQFTTCAAIAVRQPALSSSITFQQRGDYFGIVRLSSLSFLVVRSLTILTQGQTNLISIGDCIPVPKALSTR